SKRKKCLYWFLLAFTSGIVVRYAMHVRDESPARDVKQLEREIAADLPHGTHRHLVKKWLSARGYQPHVALDYPGMRRVIGIGAFVPKCYFWYGKGDIRLWFEFDDNGKLLKSSVRWRADSS